MIKKLLNYFLERDLDLDFLECDFLEKRNMITSSIF
jgi:hypothetical protein